MNRFTIGNSVQIAGVILLCVVTSLAFTQFEPNCENCSPSSTEHPKSRALFYQSCWNLDSGKPFFKQTFDCQRQDCDDDLYHWIKINASWNWPADCQSTTYFMDCDADTCHGEPL